MAIVDRAAEILKPKELTLAATGLGVAGLLAAGTLLESVQVRLAGYLPGVQIFTRFNEGIEVNEFGIYGVYRQPCQTGEMSVSELIFGLPRLIIEPPHIWLEENPQIIVDWGSCGIASASPTLAAKTA